MVKRPLRLLAVILVPFILCVSETTYAQDIAGINRAISDIETEVLQLSNSALRRSKLQGTTHVEERLTDGELFYRLQDYVRASIIFTDIVDRYPNHAAYPDALFLLGDSLFKAGDYLGARSRFRMILERADEGRFRSYLQRTLGRLIEIAIHTRDFEGVDQYFVRLNSLPSSEIEASTSYFRAKYLYSKAMPDSDIQTDSNESKEVNQETLEQARLSFESVPRGSPYFAQAQYFIGVIYTIRKQYQPALQSFQNVTRLKPTSSDLRAVYDLAQLALGRLYYETGDLQKAIDAYRSLPKTSARFDVALYEIAWAHIHSGDTTQAERALEVLSVASPESRYIPDGKILRGNLLLRNGNYKQADGVFTKVTNQFEPVRKELESRIENQADPAEYFRALTRENMEVFDITTILPPLALQWTDFEGDMKHAIGILSDLSQAKRLVRETDDVLLRMSKAINSPSPINIFMDLRKHREKTSVLRSRLTQIRKKLIAAHEQLIGKSNDPALQQVQRKRKQVERELGRAPSAEGDLKRRNQQLTDEYRDLDKNLSKLEVEIMGIEARIVATERFIKDTLKDRKDTDGIAAMQSELAGQRDAMAAFKDQIKNLRTDVETGQLQVGVADAEYIREKSLNKEYAQLVVQERSLLGSAGSSKARDIDAAFRRVIHNEGILEGEDARVNKVVQDRIVEMSSVLEEERMKLDAYHKQLGDLGDETEIVVAGVTLENYHRVQKRFYNLVMNADVGRIDVSWAEREEHRMRVEMLTRERTRQIQALDDEFSEIMDEKGGRGNK